MKTTNKMLVVGAMVIGSLAAVGCSDAQDEGAQQDGTTQVQQQGTNEASTVAANRFGFRGRADGRWGRDHDGWGRARWGRDRDGDRRGWWGRWWGRDRDDRRGWWERARGWWR
jgi:hypothetical protein